MPRAVVLARNFRAKVGGRKAEGRTPTAESRTPTPKAEIAFGRLRLSWGLLMVLGFLAPRTRLHFRALAAAFALITSVSGAGCGSNQEPVKDVRSVPAADVPELEIRSTGVDRFTTCPPPGELGQHWIPPLPAWTPATNASSGDAGAPNATSAPIGGDQELLAQSPDRTPTEIAVEATHRDFRSCYRKALVRHPTQDGRVAIVLRVGADGRVAKVESYAACELAAESIGCMYEVARRLRFRPPAGGSDTVTIPATFTSRDGVRRTVPTSNDTYTAAAYVALDGARPPLHTCEEQARREGRPGTGTGTFTMDIGPDGHVTKAHVDPWTGDQSLLLCAARALEGITFSPPTGGKGTVIARLNFNPRQEAR